MTRSRYHLGFTTATEQGDVGELPLRGAFPQWLSGVLLRTGPAKFEVGKQSLAHWFDGLAMLHRFSFAAGRVSYRNRYLESEAYKESLASGKISRREFATDPCRTLFQRVFSWFSPEPATDNGLVNVSRWNGVVVALTETRMPVAFDPQTLAAAGVREYDSRLPGQMSSAHPHYDRQRRKHYTYLIEFGRKSQYHLLAIDEQTGKESIVATIPVDRPAYMHSFGMTRQHLVFVEFPLVVNPLALLLCGKPFIRNFTWQPERGVRFHVVDKDSGQIVRTGQSEACFAFHHVNSFEDGNDVVVDIVCRPDATIIDALYLERLRSNTPIDPTGELRRFCIAAEGSVSSRRLTDVTLELPRFDYGRRVGEPYRYVYGASQIQRGEFLDSLVKVDLKQGATASWHEEGCYPGEPVFVAAPQGAAEDEGVILSVVLDTRREASFLLALEAGTFREIARAEAPSHIPFGLHGQYFADGGA